MPDTLQEVPYTISSPNKAETAEKFDDFADRAVILLKPLAATNEILTRMILDRLAPFVDIESWRLVESTDPNTVRDHYRDAEGKKYFPTITTYMTGKPTYALAVRSKGVLERALAKQKAGEKLGLRPDMGFQDCIRTLLIGPSSPAEAKPNQIRGLANKFGLKTTQYLGEDVLSDDQLVGGWRNCEDNLIHCSDSPQSAWSEYQVWFGNI